MVMPRHNPASHNCVGLAVLVQFERGTRILRVIHGQDAHAS
jgi:hypothetical protein